MTFDEQLTSDIHFSHAPKICFASQLFIMWMRRREPFHFMYSFTRSSLAESSVTILHFLKAWICLLNVIFLNRSFIFSNPHFLQYICALILVIGQFSCTHFTSSLTLSSNFATSSCASCNCRRKSIAVAAEPWCST